MIADSLQRALQEDKEVFTPPPPRTPAAITRLYKRFGGKQEFEAKLDRLIKKSEAEHTPQPLDDRTPFSYEANVNNLPLVILTLKGGLVQTKHATELVRCIEQHGTKLDLILDLKQLDFISTEASDLLYNHFMRIRGPGPLAHELFRSVCILKPRDAPQPLTCLENAIEKGKALLNTSDPRDARYNCDDATLVFALCAIFFGVVARNHEVDHFRQRLITETSRN